MRKRDTLRLPCLTCGRGVGVHCVTRKGQRCEPHVARLKATSLLLRREGRKW